MLSSISVKVLKSLKSDEEIITPIELTFETLAQQYDLHIIDLWHTKCTRCPAVLEKLNSFAEEAGTTYPNVGFYSCSLSQGPSDIETVEELINDWENLNHIFVEENDKNTLKTILGYSTVPFYFVFNKDGKIIWSGEPKQVNVEEHIPVWLREIATQSNKTTGNTTEPATKDENHVTNTTLTAAQPSQLAFDEDF